jgi:hypothetical protein
MSSPFLKLIQPFPLKSLSAINKNELSEVKSQGLKNNLLMLIYTQLQKYRDEISKNDYIEKFLAEIRPLYFSSVTRSIKQEAIEKDIIFLLQKKDIPAIIIRGNEIAREIYGEPYSRNSTDVDILIKLSDALSVDSILTDNKYSRNDSLPLKFWFHRLHHAVYYHPETNDIIEVHWNFGIPSFFRLSSEEIWREVIVTDGDSLKLTPELFIIMLLLHHHMHFFREFRILVDVLWAFHKYEDVIDWKLFAQRLRGIGLLKATLITLSQINDLWKESVQEMKSVQILQQEIERMGYKVPGFLLSYFQMDSNKKYHSEIYKDKLIARLALDKWSTIILSYFKTLFPVPEAIKELYGDRRNFTLPLNYLRFIKWRVREWTGGIS